MKRIESIDYLKGYSMFTIITFHYLQYLNLNGFAGKIIFFGGTGVHLFVFSSGLGLYLSFMNKKIGYLDFLKKRFSKIYMPYILVVSVIALVSLFIPLYSNSLYAFGGHIFLYKMFDESIMGSYGYPLWFISMIMQFYFFFYLILALKDRINAFFFISTTLAISFGWALLVDHLGYADTRIWNSFFLTYLWEFALGMQVGVMLNTGKKIPLSELKPYWYLVIGVSFSVIYGLMAIKGGVTGKLYNDIPALIGYSAIALFIYRTGIQFINRGMAFFGQIAFPLYLLHTFLLDLIIAMSQKQFLWLELSIALALTILFSIYYQKFILRFYRRAGIT